MPIFGPVLDNFVQWLHEERGYTLATTSAYLNGVSEVVRWLQSRRIGDLTELTLQDLRAAHRRFLGRNPSCRDAARALEQFLRAKGTVLEGAALNPSSTENEVESFAAYLCDARGLSKVTIREHRNPSRLQQLGTRDINAFLRQCARTNNPSSLQHIVVTLRAFLTNYLAHQGDGRSVRRALHLADYQRLPRCLYDPLRQYNARIDLEDSFYLG